MNSDPILFAVRTASNVYWMLGKAGDPTQKMKCRATWECLGAMYRIKQRQEAKNK